MRHACLFRWCRWHFLGRQKHTGCAFIAVRMLGKWQQEHLACMNKRRVGICWWWWYHWSCQCKSFAHCFRVMAFTTGFFFVGDRSCPKTTSLITKAFIIVTVFPSINLLYRQFLRRGRCWLLVLISRNNLGHQFTSGCTSLPNLGIVCHCWWRHVVYMWCNRRRVWKTKTIHSHISCLTHLQTSLYYFGSDMPRCSGLQFPSTAAGIRDC